MSAPEVPVGDVPYLPFLRRIAEPGRQPNGLVRRSVATDCRRRADPRAHVAADVVRQAGGFSVGRVVGKEFVRSVGAFLTNDVAAVRARGRLVIIRSHVQYRPETRDGSGPRLPDDGLLRVLSRNRPSRAGTQRSDRCRRLPGGVGAERRPVDRSGSGAVN